MDKIDIGKKKSGMYVGFLELIQDGKVMRSMTTKKEYTEEQLCELKTFLKDEAESLYEVIRESVSEMGGTIISSDETTTRE